MFCGRRVSERKYHTRHVHRGCEINRGAIEVHAGGTRVHVLLPYVGFEIGKRADDSSGRRRRARAFRTKRWTPTRVHRLDRALTELAREQSCVVVLHADGFKHAHRRHAHERTLWPVLHVLHHRRTSANPFFVGEHLHTIRRIERKPNQIPLPLRESDLARHLRPTHRSRSRRGFAVPETQMHILSTIFAVIIHIAEPELHSIRCTG